MFSMLAARMGARLAMSARPVSFTRLVVGVAPKSLVAANARAFVTSRPVLLPAKATKKPAASKKPAATKKSAATKKPAAKKKPATKTKVAAKTPAKRARKKAPPKKDAPVVVPRGMIPPKPHLLTPRAVFFSTAIAGRGFNAPTEEKRAYFAKAHADFTALSNAELEALAETAQKNRDAYNAQLAAWFEQTPYPVRKEVMARINKRGGRKIRRPRIVDPSVPKRPLSAFIRYSVEARASHSGTGREVVRALAASWRSLTEAEKQPYLDAYKSDFAQWKANKDTAKAQ